MNGKKIGDPDSLTKMEGGCCLGRLVALAKVNSVPQLRRKDKATSQTRTTNRGRYSKSINFQAGADPAIAFHPALLLIRSLPSSQLLLSISSRSFILLAPTPAKAHIPGRRRACISATALSSACKWAPDLRRRITWSVRPALAARNSGVRPALLRRWTEAPWRRK